MRIHRPPISYAVTMGNGCTYKVPAVDEWEARQLAIRLSIADGNRENWVKVCRP